MNAPSLRTVTVAAGFLGLSMIVAGTATAMAGVPTDEPIGTGITLQQADGATPEPTPTHTGTALLPGVPIEVGADPLLECDADGACGDKKKGKASRDDSEAAEVSTAVVTTDGADAAAAGSDATSEGSATKDDAAGKTRDLAAAGAALAACDLPSKPDLTGGTHQQRTDALRAWKADIVEAAHGCGVDLAAADLADDKGCDRLVKAWGEERGAREARADRGDARTQADSPDRERGDHGESDDAWGGDERSTDGDLGRDDAQRDAHDDERDRLARQRWLGRGGHAARRPRPRWWVVGRPPLTSTTTPRRRPWHLPGPSSHVREPRPRRATVSGKGLEGIIARFFDKAAAAAQRTSVRSRLLAYLIALTATALVIAGLTAWVIERGRIDSQITEDIALRAQAFTELATDVDPTTGEPYASSQALMREAMLRVVASPTESAVAHVGTVARYVPSAPSRLRLEDDEQFLEEASDHASETVVVRSVTTDTADYRYAAVPIVEPDGTVVGVFSFATDRGALQANLAETFQALRAGGPDRAGDDRRRGLDHRGTHPAAHRHARGSRAPHLRA
ncbi:hypothetical protein [Demequina litorisediminis]|nr:hypothetical protein [Demequina litorisediminis]